MRPIANAQDFLGSPLNDVLKSEANIRLLRVLADRDEPMSAGQAAKQAGLTEPGARLALKRLVATGFVRRSGRVRDHRYKLRHEDPLTEALINLFATERRRYEALLVALRLAVVNSSVPPRSAWIERLPRAPGDALEVGALHRPRELPGFLREMREKLSFIETSFDVTIEVNAYSRADLPDLDPAGYVELVGPPPPGLEPQIDPEEPADDRLDRESGRFAAALAELLVRSPGLVERALHHLDETIGRAPAADREDLYEWQRVLASYPIPRLQRFLTSNSPRSLRLRHSSPFPRVLTVPERTRLEALIDDDG